MKSEDIPMLFYGIIVEQSGPKVSVESCLASHILLIVCMVPGVHFRDETLAHWVKQWQDPRVQ